MIDLLAVIQGLVLTNTSHRYIALLSVAFTWVIVYKSLYDCDSSVVELILTPSVILTIVPFFVHKISTLLVMPLTVIT